MEALQLHLGCSSNPLSLDYDTWSFLAPECWLKCFWESIHHFDILLRARLPQLLLPRQHNKMIMSLVLSSGLPCSSVSGINRCRIYKRCLFLSDIVTADGRKLEEMVWEERSQVVSSFRFPREHPTRADWDCWKLFWKEYADSNGVLKNSLGR